MGLHPTRLFDTELAGRLIGLPRVGLAAVVEHYLDLGRIGRTEVSVVLA